MTPVFLMNSWDYGLDTYMDLLAHHMRKSYPVISVRELFYLQAPGHAIDNVRRQIGIKVIDRTEGKEVSDAVKLVLK